MTNQKGEWKTINGVHVFIQEGESAIDALNRTIAKSNEDKKQEQIANSKAVADRLNGKIDFSKYHISNSNEIAVPPFVKKGTDVNELKSQLNANVKSAKEQGYILLTYKKPNFNELYDLPESVFTLKVKPSDTHVRIPASSHLMQLINESRAHNKDVLIMPISPVMLTTTGSNKGKSGTHDIYITDVQVLVR